MLEGVCFLQDFRTFKKDELVAFIPGVTVLVGDQGSGKSTLIELIRASSASNKHARDYWRSVTISGQVARNIIDLIITPEQNFKIIGLDFERDSLRGHAEFVEHAYMMAQLAAMKSSHGEAVLIFLRSLMSYRSADPTLFLLDEPDTALSPRSLYELVRSFRRLASEGHQIIVSAHNPILITGRIPGDEHPGWVDVWRMEEGEYISPDDYLLAQTKPAHLRSGL